MNDTQTDNDVTFESFAVSLGATGAALVAIFTAFAILRIIVPALYITRYLGSTIDAEPLEPYREWKSRDLSITTALLQKPQRNPFKLLWQVFKYPEGEVLATVGLDGYMLLRVIHIGFWFFSLIAGLYGLAVLLPINIIGQIQREEEVAIKFNVVSIANIPPGSGWLWAHAASVYIFTFGLLCLIIVAYQRFLPLRYAFLSVPMPSRFSCLMVDLPPTVVDDRSFHHLVDTLYPGQVHSVCLITKQQSLTRKFEKRNGVVRRLEDLTLERDAARAKLVRGNNFDDMDDAVRAEMLEKVRPRKHIPWYKCCRPKVDAIRFFEGKLKRLDRKMWMLRTTGVETGAVNYSNKPAPSKWPSFITRSRQKQEAQADHIRTNLANAMFKNKRKIEACLSREIQRVIANPSDYEAFERCRVLARMARHGLFAPTGAGFVTFNNLATAQVAPQVANVMPAIGFRTMKVLRAPEPRDILWLNVGIAHALKVARSRSGFLLAVALSLAYTLPVTIISSFTSFDTLAELIPGLEGFLQRAGISRAFIQGLLPALILQIFLALVPLILRGIATYAGARSYSERMMMVIKYYFWFRIWTTLLVFSVSGTVWNALVDLVNNPSQVVQWLATSLPQLSSFYCSFIILQAWVTLPLALIGIDRLFKYSFLSRTIKTPRDRREARESAAGSLSYETMLPVMLLVFVIGTIYTSINPIVSPVCLLYFVSAYWVLKHQMLFVANKDFETGGQWFPIAMDRLVVGLLIYQLTMIGLLSLKESSATVWFLVPAPFLTLLVWRHIDQRYRVPCEYLPIDAANDPESALNTGSKTRNAKTSRWERAAKKDMKVFAAMNLMRGRIAHRLVEKAREAKARVAARNGETEAEAQPLLPSTVQSQSQSPSQQPQQLQGTKADMPKSSPRSVAATPTQRQHGTTMRFLREGDSLRSVGTRVPKTTGQGGTITAHARIGPVHATSEAATGVPQAAALTSTSDGPVESKEHPMMSMSPLPSSPTQVQIAVLSPSAQSVAAAVPGASPGLLFSPITDPTTIPGYDIVYNALQSVYLDPALRTKFDVVYTFEDGTISPFQHA